MVKNKLSDFFHFIFSRVTYLIVILILCLIIFSRLNNLFNLGFFTDESLNKLGLQNIKQTEEEALPNHKATIIYKGGRPKEVDPDLMKVFTVTEENVTPENLSNFLQAEGFITDPHSLVVLIDDLSLRDSIVPGYYEVPHDVTNLALLAKITGTPEEILKLRKEMKDNNENDIAEVETVSFTIEEGESAESVAEKLKQVGLIEDNVSFIGLLNENGLRDMISPGEYTVEKNIKNLDLAEKITINKDSE